MNAPREADLGTPAVESAESVSLEIDGIALSVPAGTSLLRAAAGAGIMIPKLCATDILKPFGSCRLCLVEIEGRRGYPSSCTTPAESGMKVRTQSPQLARLRRNVMELYISDHPLDCLTCAANGNCELQTMAGVVGLREVRYGAGDANPGENHFTDAPKDESNPYFSYDPGKCIVAARAPARNSRAASPSPLPAAASARALRQVRASPSWPPTACPAAPASRPARRRR